MTGFPVGFVVPTPNALTPAWVAALPRTVEALPHAGRLWAAWEAYASPGAATVSQGRLPEYEQQLRDCRRLIAAATPDSDMAQLAAAQAQASVLERFIAREQQEARAESQRLADLRQVWANAWQAYVQLLQELEEAARRGSALTEKQRADLSEFLGEVRAWP